MSRRDPLVSFRHMLDHAREAVSFSQGKTQAAIEADRILSLALVRLLEVIGEAASRIPPEERARHPDIAWRQIVGLRNRLIHAYDAISFPTVWEVLTIDLPALIPSLEAILTTERDTGA